MNLEILVEKFKEKDSLAFEKLYGMYYKNIFGVIHTIVKDVELAEEIAQDTFMKAWDKSETYNKGKGRFFTWILNIARNSAIDAVRSKAYKNGLKNLSSDFLVDTLEDSVSLDNRVNGIGLTNVLSTMKDKCTEIVDLLYFKGYTQKEVAEELGIPLGTVKTRNRNCILELRKVIAI